LDAVKRLLENGVITITVGGGGIPVIENEEGDLEGVAAVIDKDHASALLARRLKADLFIISTAVEYVYLNYRQPDQHPLRKVTLGEVKRYIKEGHFAPGSMLPKIEAAIYYLKYGGKEVIITDPPNVPRALRGETGTRITL
jgi:carbamate kinase